MIGVADFYAILTMDTFSLEEDDRDIFVTQDSYQDNVKNLAELVDDEDVFMCSQMGQSELNATQYSDISEDEDMENSIDVESSAPNFR